MTAKRLYDVREAAAEQLTWSITAYRQHAWIAAISLASAAEGILRGERSSDRFDTVKNLTVTCGDDEAKRSKPNEAIQWIRHAGALASAKAWGRDDAALWITGAITEMERVFPCQALPVAAQEFWRQQDRELTADQSPAGSK